MTVRERVIANRLIMKIDAQGSYAEQIGLSYEIGNRELNNMDSDSCYQKVNFDSCQKGWNESACSRIK